MLVKAPVPNEIMMTDLVILKEIVVSSPSERNSEKGRTALKKKGKIAPKTPRPESGHPTRQVRPGIYPAPGIKGNRNHCEFLERGA